MSMVFEIPETINPVAAINCAKYIATSPADRNYVYDFSKMQHCHPFGLLLIGNAIRRNKSHYKNSTHKLYISDDSQGNAFAADLGFFQYAGWNHGRKTNLTDYGIRHIPIKCLSIKELQVANPDTMVLGDMIDRHAFDLAITLTQDTTSEATKTLQYCLREMIRNTFEHGKTDKIWICGQYWTSRNEAEIALIDEGCGIKSSLLTNRSYRISSDREANKLALQPGASRMFGRKQDPYDYWQNSGYGLFMASALCGLGGYFILGSGQDVTLVNLDRQTNYTADIRGTAVCMNIKTDSVTNLQSKLNELAEIGARKAKENSGHRILTASKASTIASLISKTRADNS